MTVGQANQLALINAMIKWTLLATVIVLVALIVQYSIYQPWWKDPIGRTIGGLEIILLAEALPQLFAQFFVHSTEETIEIAYIAVVIAMLVVVVLFIRFVTWAVERRKAVRQREPEAEPSSGP